MTESTTSFTTEDFFKLLARSGLLDQSLFETQKQRFQADSPKAILSQMLAEHLVTPFQAKQLSERRHRGFFLSDKYKILDFLGQGGMSRVLLCEHLMLQRLVAVKILNKSLDKFPGAAERFLREARASASMDHPNIARVFDVDRTGLGPCIVMEYVDGTNLHELAVKHNLLDINRVAHYISQAATGLQQAHQAGLVHRDVKPANLMLDRSGTIKLLDLGLARFFDPTRSDNLTQQIDASCIIGTADYIAPEQVMDSSSADIRADIYSLGYTMYFLLTRTLPAGDIPVMRKLLWHQTREPEPVRNLRSEIPEELAAVLERMIKKSPDERYQTPLDVIAALMPWTKTPIDAPTSEEMPRTRSSDYRLGLCPPPDSVQFTGSTSSTSTAKTSSPSKTNKGSSAIRPESTSDIAAVAPNSSGSVIGYSTPLGSEAVVPTGVTIRSARTNEVMSASSETVSTSGSSYIRGLAQSTKSAEGFTRRKLLPMLSLVLAFGIGGLFTQWWFGGRAILNPLNSGVTPPRSNQRPNSRTPSTSNTVATDSDQAAVASTGIVLRGGGSTFIRPAIEHWSKIYEAQTGIKIEYSAVGSTKGVDGLVSNFLDFGCTDAFLSDEQLQAADSNIIHIPLAMGAVVPTYNVTNERDEPLSIRFTGAVLANIYLGKIKRWNDPGIAVSNPGRDLPDLEITVVYRKDGSGTTAIWTDYLSKASSTWKSQIGAGNTVSWPVGIAAEKNDGIADTVSRTVGAIGYVELSYALANGLSVGLVKNQSGSFVEPAVDGISAVAAASLRGIPADLRYSLTDAPGAGSYPIIGTCWAVIRTDQTGERGAELVRFLRWATTEGQSQLASLQYGHLPSEFSDRITTLLDKVTIAK